MTKIIEGNITYKNMQTNKQQTMTTATSMTANIVDAIGNCETSKIVLFVCVGWIVVYALMEKQQADNSTN